MEVLILLFIGLLAGVISGFLGIGGGIVIIPALVYILGYSQQNAQGTSLGLLLPPIGLLIGSYISSKIAVELPESIIKKMFAAFLLFYAIKLFLEK